MTAERSQPFFLNAAGDPIFCLHYPTKKASDEVIIICPPTPQEIMRSQAALGQLARRLQNEGYPVIRFDYRGTGDSAGASDSICLDQWLEDIRNVYTWAKTELRCQRISLIGLRLGAAMAIRASQHLDVYRLLLWDPIVDGLAYLHDMEASHARMFELNVIEPPFESQRYGKSQCWGFPWPDAWRSQLAAISPALLIPTAQEFHIILSSTDGIVRDAILGWEKRNIKVALQHVGEPMYWGDERYIKIRAFPAAHLQCIQALWEVSSDE